MQKLIRRAIVFLGLSFVLMLVHIKFIRSSLNNEISHKKCSRYPTVSDVFYDNIYWQVLEMPKGFVKLYNAYLDDRKNKTIVIVNVMSHILNIEQDAIFCQFWFEADMFVEPLVVKADRFILMWPPSWGISEMEKIPYLISCPIYHDRYSKGLPRSVSLATTSCANATNNMKIINNQPDNGMKQTFGVCSKQIEYPNRDYISRLIEWIHLLRILGASKIHLYNKYVHPDIFAVLDYFQQTDYFEVVQFIPPSGIKDIPKDYKQDILIQMTLINDCFYRTRNLYEYIAIFDTDEVIIPSDESDFDWFDLMAKYENETHDSYVAKNFYYLEYNAPKIEGIPKYMHMLQHVQGSSNYTIVNKLHKVQHKSFHKPDNVIVVHNHTPLICYNGMFACNNQTFPLTVAQLSHYRDNLYAGATLTPVQDTKIWKYKDVLTSLVTETIVNLNMTP